MLSKHTADTAFGPIQFEQLMETIGQMPLLTELYVGYGFWSTATTSMLRSAAGAFFNLSQRLELLCILGECSFDNEALEMLLRPLQGGSLRVLSLLQTCVGTGAAVAAFVENA